MVAEKKPDPFAKKPNNMIPVIAGVMILVALVWTLYEANPGRLIREETKDEKTARTNAEREEAAKARQAKKKH